MSTSAFILFVKTGKPIACIRRETDGYPDGEHGILEGLTKFFEHIEESATVPTAQQMYIRIEWLAAEYVGWCHLEPGKRCTIEYDCTRGADHYYGVGAVGPKRTGRPHVREVEETTILMAPGFNLPVDRHG